MEINPITRTDETSNFEYTGNLVQSKKKTFSFKLYDNKRI
jgi:hypothetical protein